MAKKVQVMEADQNLADMIQQFRELKDQKDELNKVIKDLNPQIQTLQEMIIAQMQGEGVEKASTSFGSVSINTKDYACIKDFAAFIHYIDTHKAYELIQKRANDAPLRLIWEGDGDEGEEGEVPGIGKYEDTKLNLRQQ